MRPVLVVPALIHDEALRAWREDLQGLQEFNDRSLLNDGQSLKALAGEERLSGCGSLGRLSVAHHLTVE